MELTKKISFTKDNVQCVVRSLKTSDVRDTYIQSLESSRRFLDHSNLHQSLLAKKRYIQEKNSSSRDVLTGLFIDHELVATCGFQVWSEADLAAVGILVFNSTPRRCGWGSAVLWAGCKLVKEQMEIRRFLASIKASNRASLGLFWKAGFSTIVTNSELVWVGRLSTLTKPLDISVGVRA